MSVTEQAVIEPDSSTRDSRVRYSVLAFLAAMTFVLYLDRVCIGQAAPLIERELGLSHTMMGVVFAAFTLAYGLFEVPTGHLGDRYGSRGVMTRIVIWWSAFTALTAAATGFWMLLVIRFLFGAGEAGALPNTARVLARWFPHSARGKAQGMVMTSMMIGGAIAPIATGYMIEVVGWRLSFVVFGAIGVVWAAAFWHWYRDDPAQHRSVNDYERDLIAQGTLDHSSQGHAHASIPWRIVLTSPNVWLMGGLMNCGAAVYYMLMTWYPTYLQEGRGVTPSHSKWLAALVLAGGAVGSLLGGVLIDWVAKRTNSARASRCLVGCAAYAMGAAAIIVGLRCPSAVATSILAALACMCLQLQIPAWWATVTQISGRHVGAMFGLMNSMGIVGAMGSQFLLGWLVDTLDDAGYLGRAKWDPGMYAYGAIMAVAMMLWFFVNPERSVVGEDASDVS